MENNPLFRLTRLRLAAWYAIIMGGILGLSSLGVYHVVAHTYRETVDQGLKSVANTLHKSIEPAWQQPKQLQRLAKELSLEICVNQTSCLARPIILQQPIAETSEINYYMRFLDRSGKVVAKTGLKNNVFISDLVEELAFLAIETQVTLSKQFNKSKKLYVCGNEEQLYRLISNLIVNAIQASNTGGTVTIFLEKNERYALIKVQDTGIGIAPEHQKQIFDRFYRVERDRSRSSGGSGLGLAIAQAITTAHHGTIQLQSQRLVGSIFTVQLPIV